MSKYIYWVIKKRLVWGVLEIEEIRDKDNEIDLKERGGIEMSTTVLPLRDASLSFALNTYHRLKNKQYENIKLNQVKRQIDCDRNDGYPKASPNSKTKFDMIVANILTGPLFDMAYDSSRWINKGGFVILSGLLIPQERYVLGAFRACGLRLIKRQHISGWSTIILRKPSIRKSSIL